MSDGKSPVSPRCAELRKLGPLVEEAFRRSMAHEGSAAYAAHEAAYQQLEDVYEALAREIWATPATSWENIVERAELAYAYANDDPGKAQSADDLGMRAAAELIMAIVQLVGGTAWRESDSEPCGDESGDGC